MQSFDPQKMIYITGATGQIGQSFRKFLSKSGQTVVVNSRNKVNLYPQEIFKYYELGDTIVPIDGDYEHIIFHFAHDFGDQNKNNTNINLIGLRNIIKGFKSISRKKIIFISTPDVNNPRSTVYTMQKKLAEEVLDHNRDLILRPSLIYCDNSKNGMTGIFIAFSKLLIPIPINNNNIAPICVNEFSKKIFDFVFNKQSVGIILLKGQNALSLSKYLKQYYGVNTFKVSNIFWLTIVNLFKLTKNKKLFYLSERILGFIYLRDINILTESNTIEVVV